MFYSIGCARNVFGFQFWDIVEAIYFIFSEVLYNVHIDSCYVSKTRDFQKHLVSLLIYI